MHIGARAGKEDKIKDKRRKYPIAQRDENSRGKHPRNIVGYQDENNHPEEDSYLDEKHPDGNGYR